jgi:glycosyltransferase involved in cell wall biosynthesis
MHTRLLKVLLVIPDLQEGGAERLIEVTAPYYIKHNMELIICVFNKKRRIGRDIEELYGVNVISLNEKVTLSNISILFKLIRVIKKARPDVIHCHMYPANFYGRIANIFSTKRKKIVITEHNKYINKKWYHIKTDELFSIVTDKVICVSECVMKFTMQQEKLINRSKFLVLYNAVQEVESIKYNISYREKYKLSKYYVVVMVSRLVSQKRHIDLLEAAKYINKKIKVVIAGDGPLMDKLKSHAKKHSINNCIFLGHVPDIPVLLSESDAFAFPSEREGHPLSLVEAMRSGLPIVASDIDCNTEILTDGINSKIYHLYNIHELAEQINWVFSNKMMAKKLGLKAKEASKTFSCYNHVSELRCVYDSLLK